MPLNIFDMPQEIRAWSEGLRGAGKKIALVPTMGALHAGHLSLVELAKKHADAVAVSIFVNPTQFGPTEDFSRYPRTPEADIAGLREAGVESVYMPSAEAMYPEGFATSIDAGPLANELCGVFRPGHFNGVATVVVKLLQQAAPHLAVFGEKDYQQLAILRHVVRDLDIPVTLIGGQIVREPDGLALSSRNRYLKPEERAIAPRLHAVLREAGTEIQEGKNVTEVMEKAKLALQAAGFRQIDYIELRDAKTLEKLTAPGKTARLLAAAYLGGTRLIDNIEVTSRP